MKKGKSKKKWIAIIAVILVIGLVGGLYFKSKTGATAVEDFDIGVEAVPLEKQDLSDSINVTGKVESRNVWVATTDVTAKIKDLNVSLGDRVEVGDVLCTFDETDVQEQISELEASISETNAQAASDSKTAINDAQNALDQAQREKTNQIASAKADLKTAKKAYKEGIKKEKKGLEDSELLSLLAAVESAEGEVSSAESGVTSAQSDLDLAKAQNEEAKADPSKTSTELMEAANAVTKAEAALNSANNSLKVANTQLKSAQAAYTEGLNKKGITKSELSALKDAVDAAQRNLDSIIDSTTKSVNDAQSALNSASAGTTSSSSSDKDLAKLKRQLSQMTVVAEQAGIVTQLNISKGSIPNGALMKIEDDSQLKVNVSINEKDIVKLKEGMKAVITSNALPDQEVQGEITQVINFASADGSAMTSEDGSVSSGSSYSANINIDPGSDLLLGMSVKVNIVISNEGEALAVPYDSIAEDENGNAYIYRGNDNGDGTYTIEKVTVQEGQKNDYYTAVEGDVSEGDIIVLYPEMVAEGDSVALSVVDGTTDLSYESEGETEEW